MVSWQIRYLVDTSLIQMDSRVGLVDSSWLRNKGVAKRIGSRIIRAYSNS
jgi:hypothetical protein